MYEGFYKLDRRPFLSTPDPNLIFWSESHTLAYTMLLYGVLTDAPISVISGGIGCGKTTLVRRVLRELPEQTVVGFVANMQSNRGELLHWVMNALGQDIRAESYVEIFSRFQDFVVETYANGGQVLLIIDEAQNLDVTQLEELRMLSNINAEGAQLLQILLVGQPQLRELLRKPELTQFAQRIAADFDIGPLTPEEVEGYIQHRLIECGASWRIFLPETAALIAKATGGVPRLINILCDLCLVYGYSNEARQIDEATLREFLTSSQRRGLYQQFSSLDPAPSLVSTTDRIMKAT